MAVDMFQRYPSPPEEIIGIAANLAGQAGQFGATVTSVESGMQRAVDAIDGDLSFPMAAAPDPVVTAGTDLSLASRFAAGALMLFAEAVITFNAGVDDLNQRWNASAPHGDNEVMSAARMQLFDLLRAEHARLEQALDADAAVVAAMLDRGPNEADLAMLSRQGLLTTADPFQNPALRTALAKPGADCLSVHARVSPADAAAWWASLTLAERLAVMAAYPHRLGNTDGLPAEVRDEANRTTLQRDLLQLEAKEAAGTLTDEEAAVLANIRRVADTLADAEQHIDQVTNQPAGAQLYIYDPWAFGGDGRIAIAVGNLDTADHVAVTVPGLGSEVSGMTMGRATTIYDESRAATSDSVAVLNWMGYDAPSGDILTGDTAGVVNQYMARAGAAQLALDIAGLRASRADEAHLTVIGNSYGSTTSAISADHFGLDADDLVLTGSPGAGDADNASDLTTGNDHTWVGSASRDAVTALGRTGWTDTSEVIGQQLGRGLIELMGNDPAEDTFGAKRFEAESVHRDEDGWSFDRDDLEGTSVNGFNVADHTRYYDERSESLYNIASVVTGHYGDVERAAYRYDPFADVDADLDVDAGVDVDINAGVTHREVFGLRVPVFHVGGDVDAHVDVDARLDVDMQLQDPERDREPGEMTHAD